MGLKYWLGAAAILFANAGVGAETVKVGEVLQLAPFNVEHCNDTRLKVVTDLKSVSSRERDFLKQIVGELEARARAVLAQAVKRGYREIALVESGDHEILAHTGFGPCRQIYLKRALLTEESRQLDLEARKLLGFSAVAQIILHEVFHILDLQLGGSFLTDNDQLVALFGFETPKPNVIPDPVFERLGVSTLSLSIGLDFVGVPMTRMDWILAEHRRILTSSGALAARVFEVSAMRSFGYPSLYSANSLKEAFAEFGSFLILDPKAKEYLKADVRDWFDAKVMGVKKALAFDSRN